MTQEQTMRCLMGFCLLATLATLFLCIVLTPVLLVIGFSGQFWPVWNGIAAHPILAALAVVAFVALIIFWLWLMIVIWSALR